MKGMVIEMIKNLIRSKKAEGYIDTVVFVLISVMVISLTVNVFSFLTVKQDLDYFARELIKSAATSGTTTGVVETRYSELASETGLYPEVSWEADYYNTSELTVQYGETITITLTMHTTMKGFGVFEIPVTLTAKQSGLSMKYRK